MQATAATYKTPRLRLYKVLYNYNRKRGLNGNWSKVDRGVLKRIESALYEYRNWWRWGPAVMSLVGRADGGSYSPPEMRPWYFTYVRDDKAKHGQRLLVVKSYDEMLEWNKTFKAEREAYSTWYKSLSDSERDYQTRSPELEKELKRLSPTEPYWHYFNEQDDGMTLIAGNVYEGSGGVNYGLANPEQKVLVRFLIKARFNNWFGLRGWIYYKALHNAVYEKVPFTCQVVPARGSGGYDHWYCHEKKGHFPKTPHRYRSYVWDGVGQVEYRGFGR